MRHGTSQRRQRNRSGGRRGGGQNGRTHVYDSNGPDVRIRGTAHQVLEKYLALSKDASSSGDIVLAESYSQYAEHYQRLINEFEEKNAEKNRGNAHRSHNSSKKPHQKQAAKAEKTPEVSDDLSLPASILGESSKVRSKQDGAVEETTS